jgi:flavin reductase (DIM6/NTAB) family NADH-FMN oxidoreductase RutF
MNKPVFNSRDFRTVLGCYPTGVCIVTAIGENNRRLALVVGSFTSISLDPPLVGFFPDKQSSTWPAIEQVGRFCVNVLSVRQLDVCRRFAVRNTDKFGGLSHDISPSGQPLLSDAIAWIDCVIDRVIEVGDHWLVVGDVQSLGIQNAHSPLLFCRGGYHDVVALEGG